MGFKSLPRTPGKPKPRKYRNSPTAVEGIKFDSKAEARRWVELRAMEAAGAITALRRQVSFPIRVNGVLICRYRADFVYVENGSRVVEDVKGMKTAAYRLKFKLMKAIFGITILETR